MSEPNKNLPARIVTIDPMRMTISKTLKYGGKMVIGLIENGKPQPNLYEGTTSQAVAFYNSLINTMFISRLWFKKEQLNHNGMSSQITFEWIGGDVFKPSKS